jgi:hypothetical protein
MCFADYQKHRNSPRGGAALLQTPNPQRECVCVQENKCHCISLTDRTGKKKSRKKTNTTRMSAVITLKSFELYNGVQEVEATREIASSFRSLNILQSRNIHRLFGDREHTCKSWFLFCLFRGGELLQMEAIQPVRCCRNKMSWLFFPSSGDSCDLWS